MKKCLLIKTPAPILNTPHFSSIFGGLDGKTLKLCERGHIRALEYVALPNSLLELVEPFSPFIYKIHASDYPSSIPLYVDIRCGVFSSFFSCEKPAWKSEEILQEKLLELEGTSYVWGGNWSAGVPDWLSYYNPKGDISPLLKEKWILKGVDCSGLLYEVTQGLTPRNTTDLVSFGTGVKIEDLSVKGIMQKVKPLDLLVWKGHVLILLDEDYVIECTENGGVIKTPLEQKLEELCAKRKPQNKWTELHDQQKDRYFVIRRWFKENSFKKS